MCSFLEVNYSLLNLMHYLNYETNYHLCHVNKLLLFFTLSNRGFTLSSNVTVCHPLSPDKVGL